jgi:hypothetical protein
MGLFAILRQMSSAPSFVAFKGGDTSSGKTVSFCPRF